MFFDRRAARRWELQAEVAGGGAVEPTSRAARKIRAWLPPLHWVTSSVSLLILALVAWQGVSSDLGGYPSASDREYYLATVVTFIAVAACLWDRRAPAAIGGLYLAGLATAGAVLDWRPATCGVAAAAWRSSPPGWASSKATTGRRKTHPTTRRRQPAIAG